jgi:hypothetical protein
MTMPVRPSSLADRLRSGPVRLRDYGITDAYTIDNTNAWRGLLLSDSVYNVKNWAQVRRITQAASAAGDGVTDDTGAIQEAADALADAGGGTLYLPSSTYLVSADLDPPLSVAIVGTGPGSIIKGSGAELLSFRGAPVSGDYRGARLEHLKLDGVGVVLGATSADHGVGSALHGVEIMNADGYGVVYRYNSWMTLLHSVFIHTCGGGGVSFDFATAGTNAGAAMKLIACNIFGVPVGVYTNGATADGFTLHLTDCDIEHVETAAIQLVSAGDNCVFITDQHFELNDPGVGTESYFDLDGGQVFCDGVWDNLNDGAGGPVYTQFVKMTGPARLFFQRSRLQLTPGKVFTLTSTVITAGSFTVGQHYTIVSVGSTNFVAIGASASTVGVRFTATGVGSGTGTASSELNTPTLIIDHDTLFTNVPFFGVGSQPWATASSTFGNVVSGGSRYEPLPATRPYEFTGGKLYVAQENVSGSTTWSATPTAPTNIFQIAELQAFDKSPRTIEFDLEVTAVGGTHNTFAISLQDGTATGGYPINLTLTLPVANGGGRVKVSYRAGGSFDASVCYNGTWVSARGTDTRFGGNRRFLVLYASTAAGGSPYHIYNLVEHVL